MTEALYLPGATSLRSHVAFRHLSPSNLPPVTLNSPQLSGFPPIAVSSVMSVIFGKQPRLICLTLKAVGRDSEGLRDGFGEGVALEGEVVGCAPDWAAFVFPDWVGSGEGLKVLVLCSLAALRLLFIARKPSTAVRPTIPSIVINLIAREEV